jgi:hypothetical protein
VKCFKKSKLYIFPQEAEERFLNLVGEAEMQQAKSMHPIDAPNGTLLWKLVKLMSWVKGHVKRTMGKLLWTVCDQKEQFVLRIGLGNALPILCAKGLVELPSC